MFPLSLLWFSQSCCKWLSVPKIEVLPFILFLPKFKWINFCRLLTWFGIFCRELFSKESHSRFIKLLSEEKSVMILLLRSSDFKEIKLMISLGTLFRLLLARLSSCNWFKELRFEKLTIALLLTFKDDNFCNEPKLAGISVRFSFEMSKDFNAENPEKSVLEMLQLLWPT